MKVLPKAKPTKLKKGKLVVLNKQGDDAVPFDFPQIKKKLAFLHKALGLTQWNLFVKFTTDKAIQKLNNSSRGINRPTDVISIPYHFQNVAPGEIPVPKRLNRDLGEIVLGMGYIQKKSLSVSQDINEAVEVTLIHGLCHLLGYTHRNEHDDKIMRERENQIVKLLQDNQIEWDNTDQTNEKE